MQVDLVKPDRDRPSEVLCLWTEQSLMQVGPIQLMKNKNAEFERIPSGRQPMSWAFGYVYLETQNIGFTSVSSLQAFGLKLCQ